MPDPVTNSVSHRDLYSYDPAADQNMRESIVQGVDRHTYGPCAHPQGLLAAIACDDATAVSNACRTAPPGTVTSFVCDDRSLAAVQDTVERTTWDILKNIVATALFGGVGRVGR